MIKEEQESRPYWYCSRCKIDNTGERMCPCPRGSCDAEVVGRITTTTVINVEDETLEEYEGLRELLG